MKGKSSEDSDWAYESTVSKCFAIGNGGHSVSLSVSNWLNVQYIQLSRVIPSKSSSVMSRLVVYHEPTVVHIPYTYTYGKTPQVCYGGYYDDHKLDILIGKAIFQQPSQKQMVFNRTTMS